MSVSRPLWQPVLDELSRWRDAGREARLWLRDDDTIAVTPALERLAGLARTFRAPVLVAIIPARALDALGGYFAANPLLDPAVHGFSHASHAPAGSKSEEFPLLRGAAAIGAELAKGRGRLSDIFGARLTPVYVPPWNRISADAARLLPAAGFAALSGFGSKRLLDADAGLVEINTHVDIIDWRGNRGGRDHGWLVRELARELAAARAEQRTHVGVLAHHLVHDETAWRFLEDLLAVTGDAGAARWVGAGALLAVDQ